MYAGFTRSIDKRKPVPSSTFNADENANDRRKLRSELSGSRLHILKVLETYNESAISMAIVDSS